MSEFDRAVEVSAGHADETYVAELAAGWEIGGGINGGLMLAMLGNALGQALRGDRRLDPFAVSGYYLSPGVAGPAEVTVQVLRAGRSMSTASASLRQGSAERLRALATYGDLDAFVGEVRTSASRPDIPVPERCVTAEHAPPDMPRPPILDRLDLRLDPAHAGWVAGRPSGVGAMRGWLRMADGREPDPSLLLFAVDALPPVTFDLGLFGWAPTLELTVHIRARPAPGWLLVAAHTVNVAGGFFEEDAEVWDSAGRLVAQSRQLARVPRG